MKKYLLLSYFVLSCTSETKSDFEIFRVERGEVSEQISFTGRIRAENSFLVRAPIDGHLMSLNKSIGSRVERGDVLATIVEPKNNSRASDLIEKEGQLRQLSVKQSQLELKIKRGKEELQTMERLLTTGSISSSEKRSSQMAQELEFKELELLKTQQNTLKQAIALLKTNQLDSSKILTSPVTGTVTELWVPEDKITPGMSITKDTVLLLVEEMGRYILKGDVMEPDYIRMQIGQGVDISLAHLQNRKWKGKIKSLAPISERDAFGIGRFQVNVIFSAPEKSIRTGLEGMGSFYIKKLPDQLRVPRSSVYFDRENYFVTLPHQKGVERRRIAVTYVGDEYVAVGSGLNQGDVVYKSFVDEKYLPQKKRFLF